MCSIYLGGGTPSLLNIEQLGVILDTVHSVFSVSPEAEVTMEANPGTVDSEYLGSARSLGINRLSLGIQSFNDRELTLLGRVHTAADAREAVRCARDSGFNNLNLDLIYGLPGDTSSGWRSTLEEAVELKPEHLSMYPLTLDGDVPLLQMIERGEVPAPDPDVAAAQYELAEELMSASGYVHYEISNWAQSGYECRHNMVYWRNMPYIGVGAAAHSSLDGRRSANTADLEKYLESVSLGILPDCDIDEEISPELQLSESVILGLRLNEGIGLDDISSRFGVDLLQRYGEQVDELVGWGLLERDGRRIRLTSRGRLLGNEVFWRLLPV